MEAAICLRRRCCITATAGQRTERSKDTAPWPGGQAARLFACSGTVFQIFSHCDSGTAMELIKHFQVKPKGRKPLSKRLPNGFMVQLQHGWRSEKPNATKHSSAEPD